MTRSASDNEARSSAPKKAKRGRANRVVLTMLTFALGVGGVMGGAHVYGQHYVKSRIVDAFERAKRGGAKTKYGAIEVNGFIRPIEGVARDVEIYVPALGMKTTLPEVTFDPRKMIGDKIEFDLPDVITIELTDKNGVPTGAVIKVSGKDAEAALNPDEDDVLEFNVTSASTRLEMETDGKPNGGFVDFTELDAKAYVKIDREAGTIDATASLSAGSAKVTPRPGAPGAPAKPALEAFDIKGKAELNTGKAAYELTAGSAKVLGAPKAEISLERLATSLSVTPKDKFDLKPLIEVVKDGEQFAQRFVAVAAQSIANGGVFDQDLTIGALKVRASDLPDPSVTSLSVDATDFAYGFDISPKVVGVRLASTALTFDLKGRETLFYDIKDLDMSLGAKPGATDFDFSPLAAVPGRAFGKTLFDVLRKSINEGGEAALNFKSGAYSSTATLKDPFLPFTSIASSTGAGVTTLTVDADSIDLVSSGDKFSLQFAGPVSGQVDADKAAMELRVPIKEDAAPQTAILKYKLDTVVIDDKLWATIDPSGALDHTITGVNIDLAMDLTLAAGLLTNPEAFAGPLPPVQPGKVTINDVTLDMLGFKGVATGAFDVLPLPAGAVDVRLTGWSKLLKGLEATPMGKNPSFISSLLIARGFIESFGAPGATEGETLLKVEFKGPAVTVNGKPVGGPPPAK
ncbi:MAG: DUF2125 domain-containing protein [Neomegalonema sp.]|nr:DUF2125 domain-containing protein [Neomegalonema sp.]